MSNFNVAKFGGTSVADYDAMVRCAKIVLSDENTRLVAVSASSGVTNHLVSLANDTLSTSERNTRIEAVETIQNNITAKLTLDDDIRDGFVATLEDFKTKAQNDAFDDQQTDELLSFGERLSSFLFTQVLRSLGAQSQRFDARQVLATNSHFGKAEPNVARTRELAFEKLVPLLAENVVVTQGFIGADEQGVTTTLGRGGSDYSAALLAEAIDATAVHIWTDVVGIFSTDPRLCEKAAPIAKLSFDEAAEMATFGAKVLHPATILPASRSGISVFVGSSRAPQEGGTWIEKEKSEVAGIRAVTQRKNQILLTVKSPEMLLASGFLARVFTCLLYTSPSPRDS